MRILLTVHQFLPEFHAGTEILTFDTAQALLARGHDVSVFTGFPARGGPDDAHRFDRYTHDGIAVERFHHDHAPMGGETNIAELEYNNRFFAAYFRDYLIRVKPDVVHFFHLQRLSASAIDVCHELGIPMVLTATDFWLVCPTNQLLLPNNALCAGPDPNAVNCLRHVVALTQPLAVRVCLDMMPDPLVAALIRKIDRGMFAEQKHATYARALSARQSFMRSRMNRVDRVTVQTRLMANVLTKYGLDPAKVALLPFGISVERTARGKAAADGANLRVGFIGTLYEHKGAHVLVEAMRLVPAEVAVEAKIYGDLDSFPEYTSRLRRMAANDSRIRFCGTFPNSDIGNVFSGLDVLVVPSIWYENTPLVIHSAQAHGCPVIASDLGGMSEAIAHDENGLLFEAGSAPALAQAIRRLAGDEALLRGLGEKARAPKPIGQYAAELEGVYREISAERRAV